MSVIDKVRLPATATGTKPDELLRRAWSKATRLVKERVDLNVLVADLSIPGPEQASRAGGLAFRRVGEGDLDEIGRIYGRRKRELFASRLGLSHGILAVDAVSGRMLGWNWFTAETVDAEGEGEFLLTITPLSGVVYLFDCFVDPETRGRGVCKGLSARILFEVAQAGAHTAFWLNAPVKAAIVKVGAGLHMRQAGRISYSRILSRTTMDLSALSGLCLADLSPRPRPSRPLRVAPCTP